MILWNSIKVVVNKKYGVTGSWTQGLVHAKHALYQLSYNPVMSIWNFGILSYLYGYVTFFGLIIEKTN